MRTKVTLVLLFLNLVLFFFIFYFEREWRSEREFLDSQRRVLGPETADVQSLEISGVSFPEPVRLERRAGGWHLTEPTHWPANPNAVSRILHELQFLEQEASFAVDELASTGLSLADYGLDQPRLTVAFTGGKKRVEVRIGEVTPAGNRLYILSPDGARIHVVGRSLVDSLALNVNELRSSAVFNILAFEVQSLGLQLASPSLLKVRLSRSPDSRWLFEAPIVTRADKDRVILLINGLNALKVGDFLDVKNGDADRYGLLNPAFRITLEGNERRESLLLGNAILPASAEEEVRFFAKTEESPAVFTVSFPRSIFDTIRNAQEALRDRHVLEFNPDEVTSIALASPGYPEIVLQRLETGLWQVVSRPADQPLQTFAADERLVGRLIQRLFHLEAAAFVTDAPSEAELETYGFKRPERQVTLTLAPSPNRPAGALTQRLLLGSFINPQPQASLFAKRANAPFIYAVDQGVLREIPTIARYYRDRLIRELPQSAQITRLALTAAPNGEALYARALSGAAGWETALADEPEERRRAVLALLQEVRILTAARFALDRFTETPEIAGENRPWPYLLEATVSLAGDNKPEPTVSRLYFSERLSGGTLLIGSPEFDVVFEANQEMLDALSHLLYAERDPGPPPPRPAPAPPAAAAPVSG